MSFIPYLNFDGTAREAMTFYADVFGATDLMLMPFSDAPPDAGFSPDQDRIMHAQFSLDGQLLMASDLPEDMAFTPQASVSVSHMVTDADAGRALFDKLADGGEVVFPYAPTFFAPAFGMLKDRFGTHWMIMVDTDGPA